MAYVKWKQFYILNYDWKESPGAVIEDLAAVLFQEPVVSAAYMIATRGDWYCMIMSIHPASKGDALAIYEEWLSEK